MIEPGARVMSLDEVIATAASRNVEAKTSDVEIEGAEATRMGSRGELLPKVHLDGSIQEWNSAFALPFAIPGVPGPTPVLTVRDAFTWTFGATIIQPITGLWSGLSKADADKLGIDIAKMERESTKRDVSFRAAEGYLRLLEAKRLVEVARASVTTLEAQRKQAQSLFTNGVIAKNDLLRAELALSNAKQREIQARGNVVLGRGRLGVLLGLPASDKIDVAPIAMTADPVAAQDVSPENAEQQAMQRRLEVVVFQKKIEQADSRVGQAKGAAPAADQRRCKLHALRRLRVPAEGLGLRRARRLLGHLGLGHDVRTHERGDRPQRRGGARQRADRGAGSHRGAASCRRRDHRTRGTRCR